MTKQYKVKGTNDDRDFCECCGKTGLKKVVWLESLDAEGGGTGDLTHVGTSFAAHLMERTQKEVKHMAKAADQAERDARSREANNAVTEFVDWVATKSDKPSHFERLQELGGFKAARDAHEAAA